MRKKFEILLGWINTYCNLSILSMYADISIIWFVFSGSPRKDDLLSYHVWGSVITEVEIDTLTGEKNIRRYKDVYKTLNFK